MTNPNAFLERFTDPAPALVIKFGYTDPKETPKTVKVKHRLGSVPSADGRLCLKTLEQHAALRELCEFYKNHDGAELCKASVSQFREAETMLEFKSVDTISKFTSQYRHDGENAWVIDYNKTKKLYRCSESWIVFAKIGLGPSCLTIFLRWR